MTITLRLLELGMQLGLFQREGPREAHPAPAVPVRTFGGPAATGNQGGQLETPPRVQAPEVSVPGEKITVHAHIRHGQHGYEAVKEHQRAHEPETAESRNARLAAYREHERANRVTDHRAPTEAEVDDLRAFVRTFYTKDGSAYPTPTLRKNTDRGPASVALKRYEPFSAEEAAGLADWLEARGWVEREPMAPGVAHKAWFRGIPGDAQFAYLMKRGPAQQPTQKPAPVSGRTPPPAAPPVAQKITVASKPMPLASDADRPLETAEATKLAAKAREKGERLIAKWQPVSESFGNENTHRRATMGANKRDNARFHLTRGKQLVAMADAIDQGSLAPTAFDEAMLNDRAWREARTAWSYEGRDPEIEHHTGRPEVKQNLWAGMTVVHKPSASWVRGEAPEARAKRERAAERAWKILQPHLTKEDVPYVNTGARALDALRQVGELAKKHDLSFGGWEAPHLEHQAHIDIGWHAPRDRAAVADRYERWRQAASTGKVAPAKRPYEEAPDRSRARDSFHQRLERAEADEGKRYIPPELQSAGREFFETPAPWAERMIQAAEIEPGMKVLEPSAGRGGIADRLPGDVHITVAEQSPTLAKVLEAKGYGTVHGDAMSIPGKFDRVVMNPPFSGHQDIEHVRHAFDQNLSPGGKLVAIMSSSAMHNQDRKASAFREWLDGHDHTVTEIPGDAWKRSGTAVHAVMVTVHKPG